MAYECKIVLDSIGPAEVRLTTFEVTFPRIVLAEFNTHRMLSRNSASSRAIPIEKMIERVETDPFIPVHWGKKQKGMQAEEEVSKEMAWTAEVYWLRARDKALEAAKDLLDLGLHKQITNRLLEPFLWHTVICTATEWENFFNLRDSPLAQPEIQRIAALMKNLYTKNVPQAVEHGDWHLPLVTGFDREALWAEKYSVEELCMISAARCARVSYLTHDKIRDPHKDLDLCESLIDNGHMSPLEHPAQARLEAQPSGNLVGWRQYRKMIPNEAIFRSKS